MNLLRRLPASLHRFIAVGAVNTLLSWSVYWLALPFCHHQVAFVASFLAGVGFSAWAHSRFSFGLSLGSVGLAAYLLYCLLFYILCAALLELVVRMLLVPSVWGNVVVTVLTLPVNYLGSRWLMTRFRHDHPAA